MLTFPARIAATLLVQLVRYETVKIGDFIDPAGRTLEKRTKFGGRGFVSLRFELCTCDGQHKILPSHAVQFEIPLFTSGPVYRGRCSPTPSEFGTEQRRYQKRPTG